LTISAYTINHPSPRPPLHLHMPFPSAASQHNIHPLSPGALVTTIIYNINPSRPFHHLQYSRTWPKRVWSIRSYTIFRDKQKKIMRKFISFLPSGRAKVEGWSIPQSLEAWPSKSEDTMVRFATSLVLQAVVSLVSFFRGRCSVKS
jgi:hypothetical protein